MQHSIGSNIVNITNQLSFAYWGIAPELYIFVSLLTKSTRAADFIRTLKGKQEVWHKIMTIPTTSHRYYNSTQKPSSSLYMFPLLSQSKTFAHYQSHQCLLQAHLPWRGPKCLSNITHASPVPAPQRPYMQSSFCQIFISLRQHYPSNAQQNPQVLLPIIADCDHVFTDASATQSAVYDIYAAGNLLNHNLPHQPANNYQAIPC